MSMRVSMNEQFAANQSMGWFDGGSSDPTPSESAYNDSSSFSGASSGSYGGTGGGLSELHEFSVNLQQQMVIQQVITELAQKSFDKCCPSASRDSQLTSKESSCIAATTQKWLDTNEFLVNRLARKQQAATSRNQL